MSDINYYGAFCEALFKLKELVKENINTTDENGVVKQNRNNTIFELDGKNFTWVDLQTLIYILDGSSTVEASKEIGIGTQAFSIRKTKLAEKMGSDLKWHSNKFYKDCFRFLFDMYPKIVDKK